MMIVQQLLTDSFDVVWLFLCSVLAVLQLSLLIYADIGWTKAVTRGIDTATAPTAISLVIPFRNEASDLPRLISDLRNSVSESSEIIFVDDHSTDDSVDILEASIERLPHRRVLSSGEGKKAALLTGIQVALHDTIHTLDADISLHPKWYQVVTNVSTDSPAALTLLPVLSQSRSTLISKLASLEHLSLQYSTFSSVAQGCPIMASGANLQFHRALVSSEAVQTDIASGDDMFLLHHAKRRKEGIAYSVDPRAAAVTRAPETIGEWWSQRLRWTAKASAYTDRDTLLVAWVVFLSDLLIVLSVLLIPLMVKGSLIAIALLFLLRIPFQYRALSRIAAHFKMSHLLKVFPLAAMLYPFFTVSVVVASRFTSFEWKGRAHSR